MLRTAEVKYRMSLNRKTPAVSFHLRNSVERFFHLSSGGKDFPHRVNDQNSEG